MNVAVQTRPSIRFRGRSLLALVLAPQPPLEEWLTGLADWNQRSPGFFAGRPVILDASNIETTEEGLAALVTFLAEQNVRLMGVEGVDPAWLGVGMPPPIGGGIDASIAVTAPVPDMLQAPPKPEPVPAIEPAPEDDPTPEQAETPAQSEVPALVLDEPVRSGQTIVFPDGDVTVIGSVASGAEVIAGGSIHVYGSLRGRAIAGATGKSDARIFCGRLEAELLAIDGLYRTADDIAPEFRNVGIHAWLDNDALRIAVLT